MKPVFSRRGSMLATGAAGLEAHRETPRRKFTMALVGRTIKVDGALRQQLDWATKYGYESIEPKCGDLMAMSAGKIDEFTAEMKEKGVQWAVTFMPVQISERSEEAFAKQLAELPKAAKVWQAAGATRVKASVGPQSRDLTYLQNFKLHTGRVRRSCEVLSDNGIRFGLEYVAPKTLWTSGLHTFIHTMAELQELRAAVNVDNVGIVLDSWHWYCAHESVDDLLALKNEDVVSVDLNDAPAGIEIDEQIDNRRRLPATTGVIDVKGFLEALVKIGFDGPIMAEPFDPSISAMNEGDALQITAETMKRAFQLIE